MGHRLKSRKRPCRICRKWFYPDPRVGDRQKTCGDKDCQVKWHSKKCAEWNQKNQAYFREVYLSKKLSAVNVTTGTDDYHPPLPNTPKRDFQPLSSVRSSRLPSNLIQEVIGAQHFVIIEYMIQLLFKFFQEKTSRQLTEIKREFKQLPHEVISRGDSPKRGP